MSEPYQQCLRKAQANNLRNLLAVLRKINVQEVEMTYKVIGKTGAIDAITLKPRPPVSILNNQHVKWFQAEHPSPENNNTHQLKPITLPVIKALECFALSWVESLYPHWQSHASACGHIEIMVSQGDCFLDHFKGQLENETSEQVIPA